MSDQLSFDGLPARCDYIGEVARPHRGDPCQHACTLPPHGDEVAHRLEWEPIPQSRPILIVIQGGLL